MQSTLEAVNRLREQARKGHSDHDDRLDGLDASIADLEATNAQSGGQSGSQSHAPRPREWTLDKHSLKTF